MRKTFVLITILLAATCAFAEGTRTWQQSTFQEFEKGTTKAVAIRSDGTLELAPSFKAVTTTPSTYLWALASDVQGNVYAAAGSPARVYLIAPTGQTSVIFEPRELQVQSLVVDSSGAIYAATSPDGKVYKIQRRAPEGKPTNKTAARQTSEAKGTTTGQDAPQAPEKNPAGIDPNWTSSVWFEPKTKYIWALAVANDGGLFVATGDRGEVFRVDRNGQSSLHFKSDEAHIRALAIDPQGNLIAGSDGSGLVYRISPRGEAFVLYSAPKKEITALTVDRTGNIYAAGVGEKRVGGTLPVPTPGTIAVPANALPGASGQGSQQPPTAGPGVPMPGMGAIGSEVYQIAPDGSPKRLWASRDDVVYALALDQRGTLLAGTGNKGKVFAIVDDERFTDLQKASATQVTAFATAPNGGLYVSTSNLGKLFLLGATPDAEGSYQSDVFDAKIFSRWGRADVRGSGAFELWARSGNVDNPDRNWSIWKLVDLTKDTPLAVPPARFIQWRAVLRPSTRPAQIESVVLNYLPKNVAPKVDDVAVQVGSRFQGIPRRASQNGTEGGRSEQLPPTTRDRDSIAVRWSTHDDNDDQLAYSIYYRGDGEQNWKLLQDKLIDRFYWFDAGLLPDGGYTVRVIASDAPSHSPEEALSDENESTRFEVDTTPPQVQDLNAAIEGDQLHITFRAVDGFSDVRRAEFSVDAGEWQYVEPVGQLSDYRLENYDFNIPVPGATARVAHATAQFNGATAPMPKLSKRNQNNSAATGNPTDEPTSTIVGEHLVVVRVYDKFDNVGVAKTVIRGR
ncbi:MAG TPA: hypothetical protein VD837_12520 [Terriglobales bacterium]|nr:hypothetical protein [Terriglobales bacterium]